MGLRNIREMGDPLLRKVSRPVKEVNGRIRSIMDDMAETMYASDGIGLAAPQVGILRRMIVVDVGDGRLFKMVNPEIIKQSEDDQTLSIEGCLSIPDYNGTVYRPRYVTVRYQDESGEEQILEAEDLLARCLCHEIDHLDGILFADKVDMLIDFNNLTDEMVTYLVEKGLVTPDDIADESDAPDFANADWSGVPEGDDWDFDDDDEEAND